MCRVQRRGGTDASGICGLKEAGGGFVGTALGHGIATQGETVGELREMVRDAVRCHFGDGVPGPMPIIIRLQFVRDEALAV